MFVEVTEFLSNLFPSWVVSVFTVITVFAEQYVSIAAVGLIYWCIDKDVGQFVSLSTAVSLSFNNGIKNVFQVKRPFDVSDKVRVTRKSTATGYSFPSGHTQNVSAVAFSASAAVKKRALTVVSVVYTALVAFSRLVLGVHYITDVLGAVLFSVVCIAITALVHELARKKGDAWLLVLCVMPLFSIFSVLIKDAQPHDALTAGGVALGTIVGIVVERYFIRFDVGGSVWRRALRFVLGFALVLGVLFLFKAILPDTAVCRVVRYALVGFAASAVVPWASKKLKL